MFLNLKSKKYVETVTHQPNKPSNHPKTHRQEVRDRNSKEHKQIKSHRQHQTGNQKRQVGSTAVTTLQPSNASFTHINPQFKIKIKEPSEKDSLENINSSQEKLDSYRLARVTSAYKKIKKFDVSDHSFTLGDELTRSQERLKRTVVNKSHKRGLKKQQLNNIVQNYMCATEGDEQESKIMQKLNSGRGQMIEELLHPFLELFSQQKTHKFKERSYSHRQLQMKRSLDRNSRNKKNSNQILIKEDNVNAESSESIEDFIMNFYQKLGKVKEKIDTVGSSKKYKYVESPSLNIFEQLYQDIENFVSNFYQLCLQKMEHQLKKCQYMVSQLLAEENNSKKQLAQIKSNMKIQKQKSQMLEKMVLHYQDKCLYSTIFMNELSFTFDVDTHLREKLFEQAKKNGLVSSYNESQILEEGFEMTHRSQGASFLAGHNIYDNNQNDFTGYNIAGFGNCIGAKNKQKDNNL